MQGDTAAFTAGVCAEAALGGYAGTFHRDLDATAVSNLKDRGAVVFINAWVPLAPVKSRPLAVLKPASCDFATDPAPFRGLAYDTTGLNHNPSHEWVSFRELAPTDVLLFRSDTVYHGALDDGEGDGAAAGSGHPPPPPRQSVDLRLVFYAAGSEAAVEAEAEAEAVGRR